MVRYRIEIVIEKLGFEGEVEDYIESSIFYVNQRLYKEFKILLESKVKL
jgi:hypothetical protein